MAPVMTDDLVYRYDRGEVRKAHRDPRSGFFHVDCTATSVGVFPYLQSNGQVRRELRPPDEVLSKENLATIARTIVTDEHPFVDGKRVAVTTDNVSKFQRGHADSDVRVREGKFADVGLVVTDAGLIKDVDEKVKVEVSSGYHCQIDHVSGIWRGIHGDGPEEPYDVIQRGHRTNHIAITKRGRLGSEVRLHADSLLAVEVVTDDEPQPEPNTMKITLNIDGASVELDPAVASIIKPAIEKMEGSITGLQTRFDALTTDNEKLTGERDQAVADLKAKTEELEQKGDSISPEAISTLVEERTAVMQGAALLLDSKALEAVKKEDNAEIRRVCVRAHTEMKLPAEEDAEGFKADSYVEGRFEVLVEDAESKGKKKLATAVVHAVHGDSNHDDINTRIAKAQADADARSRGKGHSATSVTQEDN